MRILLDHCIDWRLGRWLTGHQVASAGEMHWERLRNGKLLAMAASQFDLLLTADRQIKFQQNLAALPVSVVVLIAASNKLADLVPLIAAVEETLRDLQPRTLVEVSLGGRST